jgi:hypothetical protein
MSPAMRLGIATALALFLAAPAALAAKPPPCAAGRFVVEAAASPLVPGGAAVPDELVLGEDGTLSLASGCPAVAAKQKGSKKGNKLAAKWTKKQGLCTGMAKTATLKASFDAACNALAGSFKSKGLKRAFAARRRPEGLGSPSLAPALDAARAVTESIGPAGGEVRARGADGTKYVLLVPPGALSAEVAITMTPATAVGGLPLTGGLVGAVELAPDGLPFALPAELKLIRPPGSPTSPQPSRAPAPRRSSASSSPGRTPSAASPRSPSPTSRSTASPSRGPRARALHHRSRAHLGPERRPLRLGRDLRRRPGVLGDHDGRLVRPRGRAAHRGRIGGAAQALSGNEALLVWRTVLEAVAQLGHPGPWPESVTSQLSQGLVQNHANLLAQIAAYTKPGCSGAVSDWKDWLRIPDLILEGAQPLYQGAQLAALDPTGRYCVALAFRDVSFPEEVAEGTTSLPLSFETVVEAPGGDVGVASQLLFVYETDNASGPTDLVTAEDGSASLTVTRSLGTPLFVEVLFGAAETTLGRPELVTSEHVSAGSLGLAFEADFDPAPQAYLEPLSEHEVCVLTTLEPFAGQTVSFFLDGPGDIAPAEAVTVDDGTRGRACIEYIGAEAPVAKDLEALLTATLVAGGQTYQDTLHLHPAWVDVRLHADVGEGWVPATNQTLDAEGEGPFDLRGTFTMNPPHVGDPPPYPPFAEREVTAETDENTLRRLGTVDLFKSIVWATDALGRLDLEWDGVNANQSVSTITFLATDLDDFLGLDPVAAASVTLDRGGLPDMGVQFPSSVLPGVATPLVVTVYQDGEPPPGYHVEVEATGGTVSPASGTTDVDGQLQASATLTPGETLLTLTVTLREDPGGPVLDVQTVQAVEASDDALVVLVDRRDQCGGCGPVLLGPRVGPVERDGTWAGGGTSSLDSDVQTADGTLASTITTIVADGSGSQDEPSPVNPFSHFRAEFRVEAPVLATFSFTATGATAVVFLYPLDGSGVVLGCAPLGESYCPNGEPAAGTVELAPGLYAVSGEVFYQGTSFHLEIGFTPAP